MSALRIGMFAHSTNPRGGVVHAMQVCEALCELGLDATLIAPSVAGREFYRRPACTRILIPAPPIVGDVERLVGVRRRGIADFLASPAAPDFDALHAQDSISALALSDLVDQRRIPGFLRTVHHLDDFASTTLAAWQDEAVRHADGLFCVSRLWQDALRRRFGRDATRVGNGVDSSRFSPTPTACDADLRRRLPVGDARFVLAIGGVEQRKNTLAIVRAFLLALEQSDMSDLQLVIAGGASLLDHTAAQARFADLLATSRHAERIHCVDIIDDADMPSLYRSAAMLCFPSLQEGFGLCVLEALACGIPVIAPQGAPYDDYLQPGDAFRVDPGSDQAIAAAIRSAADAGTVAQALIRGPARARAFSWRRVAEHHLADYAHHAETVRQHA